MNLRQISHNIVKVTLTKVNEGKRTRARLTVRKNSSGSDCKFCSRGCLRRINSTTRCWLGGQSITSEPTNVDTTARCKHGRTWPCQSEWARDELDCTTDRRCGSWIFRCARGRDVVCRCK